MGDADAADLVQQLLRRSPPCSGAGCGWLALQLMDIKVSDEVLVDVEHYSSQRMSSNMFTYEIDKIDESKKRPVCHAHLFALCDNGATCYIKIRFDPSLVYELKQHHVLRDVLKKLAAAAHLEEGRALQYKEFYAKHMHGWIPSTAPGDEPGAAKKHRCIRVFFPSLAAFYAARKNSLQKAGLSPWEGNVDPSTMFVDKTSLRPSKWFEVHLDHPGSQVCLSREGAPNRLSHCDIEIRTVRDAMRPLPTRDDVAPMLIASVDIECFSESNAFPLPENEHDAIMVIATCFWRHGDDREPLTVVQAVLRDKKEVRAASAAPPEAGGGGHASVVEEFYESERELLEAWRDLVTVRTDVDVVIGFNTFGFDYNYIVLRAATLRASRFGYNGKLISSSSKPLKKALHTARGQRDLSLFGWTGRTDVDVMLFVEEHAKLSSYSLNAVSSQYLNGEQKVDLPIKEMNALLRENSWRSMRRVMEYCVQDVHLPMRLCKRLQIIPSLVEMSRVTMTFINQLSVRGQQFKVFNQLVWHAHRQGFVLNPTKDDHAPRRTSTEDDTTNEPHQKYQGATVIPPQPGFYDTCIATLDFASLYPSIMMGHNICYSTLVKKEAYLDVPGVEYETHEPRPGEKVTFVKSMQGVIPAILVDLVAARKQAKADKASATDAGVRNLCDKRQLALKISCNSVYGFTGAEKQGLYADATIAMVVTCVGRNMIQRTIELVEAFIDCKVIYGDTDSVMIRFRDESLTPTSAFALAVRAADHVNNHFVKQIKIEPEKIYKPYLLLKKKRYIGLMWTPDDRTGEVRVEKLDAKGVELRRRDNCAFAKQVLQQIVDPMMWQGDVDAAIQSLKENLLALTESRVPLDAFVVTKQLKKRESYANTLQPHIVTADKILQRTGVAPQSGDRVGFYIAEPSKAQRHLKTQVSLRAEDPQHGKEANIKPDRLYYLEHQIFNPVMGLFEEFGDKKEIVEKALNQAANDIRRQQNGQMDITSFFSSASAPPSKRPKARS